MSIYSGIQTSLSGLAAHQKALETIGHNVANSATEGYNRRRVELGSVGAGAVPAVFSKLPSGGNGVEVTSLVRAQDQFLDSRVRAEVANGGALLAEARALGGIERALPEPSDTGLAEQLGDFWAAWNDVANQPDSTANRAALLEQATTTSDALRRASGELGAGHAQMARDLEASAAEANATAGRIAELNAAIRAANAAGLQPSDLADQRDLLATKLSELVGGSLREADDGMVDIFVGGSALVRGDKALVLGVRVGGPTSPDVGLSSASVVWEPSGKEAGVSSGEVAGLLKGLNDTIPRYLAQLDGVAAALVGTVNAAHAAGYNLAGDTTGLDFFDPAGTRAATIGLSADVAGQPGQIAAGSLSTVPGATRDGSVAQAIAKLSAAPGGADARYRTLIGSLGVEAQAVYRRVDMQEVVTSQVTAERQSHSGVSLDEELANMVSAQHAYAASARVLTAVDQMLDTLLNRTGVVGR